MKKILLSILLSSLSIFAFADEDGKTICQTDESKKADWIFLEDAKKQVAAMGYDVKDAHTSKGLCYEMLVIETKTGKRQEIYFDPITLAKIKTKEVK